MKLFGSKPELASSTPFSDFIRNAKSGEKKRVYARVIAKASKRQQAVLESHACKA